MSDALKKCYPIMGLYVVALVCGVGGFASQTEAQATAAVDPSGPKVVSALVGASSTNSEKLRSRVVVAMRVDPYLLDEHIEVAVVKNKIVLRGFVLSAGDLQEAIRVARKAAGGTRVVDELSIADPAYLASYP
jgi:hypothetical protein